MESLYAGGNRTRKSVKFKKFKNKKSVKFIQTEHEVVKVMQDRQLQKIFAEQKAAKLPQLCRLDLGSDKVLQEHELTGRSMESSLHKDEDESLRHPKNVRALVNDWQYDGADPALVRNFLHAH